VDQGGRSIRTGPYRVVLGSPQRPFQILRPKNPWTAVVCCPCIPVPNDSTNDR
jgi:hypothetical protein